MKLSTNGFKKVSGDQHSTTMKNDAGHTLTISHKHLSPKWKAQLVAMPAHGAATPERAEEAHTFTKPKSQQPARVAALADGGEVEKSPPLDLYEEGGGISGRGVKVTNDYSYEKQAQPGDDAVQVASNAASNLKGHFNRSIKSGMEDGGRVMMAEGGGLPINLDQNSGPQLPPVPQGAMQLAPPIDPNAIPTGQARDALIAQEKADNAPYGAPPPAPPQVHQQPAASGPATSPQPSGPGFGDMLKTQAAGVHEQEAGLKSQLGATQELGKGQEAIAAQQAAYSFAQAKEEKNAQQAAQQSYEHFAHDVQNNHIKPNHFMETAGTPQKVSMALGMLFGSLSGSPGSSAAQDYIKNQIDRDVQAQEKNLASSENLLHHNLMQTRNMQEARALTRAQINAGYMHQMEQVIAKNKSPQAMAAFQQAHGVLQQQNGMLLSGIGQSDSGNMPVATAIMVRVPQHEQAEAMKELKESEILVKEHNNMLNAIDQVAKLQTIGNRVGSPVQSKQQIAAIMEPRVAALSKATAGRLTPQDVDMLRAFVPNMMSGKATVSTMKQEASKLIQEKMSTPVLEKYRINAFQSLRNPNSSLSGQPGASGQIGTSFKPAPAR